MYYSTNKFEDDAYQPSCFQQLQPCFFYGSAKVQYPLFFINQKIILQNLARKLLDIMIYFLFWDPPKILKGQI